MTEDTPHTISRFVETVFDNKKFPPVCGYWSEKLVPLETALKFIEPGLGQLESSVNVAKQCCHFPSDHGLTHDESAALYLYTMEEGDRSFHRLLNQALRSGDRSVIKPWFLYLKLLDTALSKLPTVKKNIWRGGIGDISEYFKKNEELTWRSVTSCSSSMHVIKDLLVTEPVWTLILIEAVHGKCISGYTKHPSEDEVLLSPNTQLRVVANVLDHPGGVNVVHLIEVSEDSDENLPSTMTTMHASPKSTHKDVSGMKQQNAASTWTSVAQLVKRRSFSNSQEISDLPCGGRYDHALVIWSSIVLSAEDLCLTVGKIDEQVLRCPDCHSHSFAMQSSIASHVRGTVWKEER